MTPPAPTWTLTARWLFPVDKPPLERGTITISGERIVAVELHGTRIADVDLGDCAVLPTASCTIPIHVLASTPITC